MGGYGWGEISKNELLDAVKQAFDYGINFFDSADVYGLGQAELTLGEALFSNRQKAIIATKFGVRIENGKTFYDNSKNWIEKALENSLRRLKTDYVDIYQLHYRDSFTPMDEIVQTLDNLKDKGWIRYYGLSNIKEDDIQELKRYKNKFVCFQNEFSLACRKNEKEIIRIARELRLSPLAWGSLGQGVLTGKYNQDTKFGQDDRRSKNIYVNFHGDRLKHNLQIVDRLKNMAKELNQSIPAIAIRWILDFLPGSVVLTGIKNRKQLQSNASALGWKLNQNQINALEKISGKMEEYIEQ